MYGRKDWDITGPRQPTLGFGAQVPTSHCLDFGQKDQAMLVLVKTQVRLPLAL